MNMKKYLQELLTSHIEMMKKLLFVFGTRPEAIKMAPVIRYFQQYPERWQVKVCVTAQHREMLDQVLDFFEIKPDFDLNLMMANQGLSQLTARILEHLAPVMEAVQPDIVFVQGDTTTAFAASLSAFYHGCSVAHIEAGLRSGNRLSPFPEEVNRILTGHMASWHFAPTSGAAAHLLKEGITENVFVTGNSVIDALLSGIEILKHKTLPHPILIPEGKRLILVTGHRRESFGAPFEAICLALKRIADTYPDVHILYPVHLNPHVQEPVYRLLGDTPNIQLCGNLSYPELLQVLSDCYLVLTDSGGIQEEAPALGKPVLVMREVTERQEGIDSGTAKLVGTDGDVIYAEACILLDNNEAYMRMAKATNPYGDGTTAKQIEHILRQEFDIP